MRRKRMVAQQLMRGLICSLNFIDFVKNLKNSHNTILHNFIFTSLILG